MHEMSVAQSLVDILKEEMTRHGATVLKSARLRIGQLSAVVPESLSFCFEVITSGTDMEGAQLLMELVPLAATCLECRKEFEIKANSFSCPYCSSPNIETISGHDLSIVEMEVE